VQSKGSLVILCSTCYAGCMLYMPPTSVPCSCRLPCMLALPQLFALPQFHFCGGHTWSTLQTWGHHLLTFCLAVAWPVVAVQPCPQGTTTENEGARSADECICPAGFNKRSSTSGNSGYSCWPICNSHMYLDVISNTCKACGQGMQSNSGSIGKESCKSVLQGVQQ